MPTAGLEFAKVSFTPAGGHPILYEITLSLPPGTTTALLGRSGSGKTTLLRTVNGLVRPTSGEVTVNGERLSQLQAAEQLVRLRRSIGYVIQETGLFPHMSVERNVGLSLELEGQPKPQIRDRAQKVTNLVGLDFLALRERFPWQLSGGQRQRVGLARALALDPPVLLMDEPFGALDPLTRNEMQTMFRDLQRQLAKTVLLVTHDLDEALFLADRVIIMDEGQIVADLPSQEILRSENHHVKKYVSAAHHSIQMQ